MAVSLVILLLAIGIVSAATLDGTIAKVDGDKLTVTDKNKKDTTFTVNKDAKITLDGKAALLTDLKKGQPATVTYDGANASAVDAKSK
jgi:hypothetical protein